MQHVALALSIPLAALLAIFAVPAGLTGLKALGGRLDRRGRLGLTTPAARASDDAFALANRVAAPLNLGAAAVGIVCAAVVLALPIGAAGAILVTVLALVGVFGQLAFAARLGERAARTVPLPARKPAGGGCCGSCGCGGSGDHNAAPLVDARLRPATALIPDLVADAVAH